MQRMGDGIGGLALHRLDGEQEQTTAAPHEYHDTASHSQFRTVLNLCFNFGSDYPWGTF